MSEKVSLSTTVQSSETSSVVPTDTVPLPSRGVVYPKDFPLHQCESIDIRSMTAVEEDILTSRALMKNGRVVSALLKSCIVDKKIDVDKMLVGDRNAALIAIRITGYGPEYKVSVPCPECGEKSIQNIDLSRLPIKRLPENVSPIHLGSNEFEIALPFWKKKVIFKLFTGEAEKDLIQTLESSRKLGIQEELVTTRLKSQIVSIDGERDLGKLATIIRSFPARDSRFLRNYIDKMTPGVDLIFKFVCPLCDFEDGEVEVPLGTEFFWPKA